MEKKPFLTESMAQDIIQDVPTPFHVYDEKGIRENARRINKAFSWNKGFREYFAVKALPNPVILQILKEEGCGVDCSSLTELMLSEVCGFSGSDIMFSSNQTPVEDMKKAYELGAYINLDDATMVDFLDRVAGVPENIFCRYNPGGTFQLGESKEGFQVMDKPGDAKYGMTEEQMIDSYKKLAAKGAKNFGIHAFLASNTISDAYYPELAGILFQLAVRVQKATGVHIAYINLSGGVGIPYRPEQTENDIMAIGEGVRKKFEEILVPAGMGDVSIFTEMGRFTTGPYGALVATAIHEKHIYKEYIGLDACAANLMRPAMYGAYHHITVLGKEDAPHDHKYDVVGGLCENNDKFAIDRMLPKIDIGAVLRQKAPRLARWIPRPVVNWLRRTIHESEINHILEHYWSLPPQEFIRACFREWQVTYSIEGLDKLAPGGRYLFASNHPFGGMDGMMLADKLIDRFGDARVVVNDLLMYLEPLRPLWIPVNKHGAQSASYARKFDEEFFGDLPVLTFPAGLCSRPNGGEVTDPEWKISFLKKAYASQRQIVPVFVEGRLSKFFYRVYRIRKALGVKFNIEMLWLPDEMFSQKCRHFRIVVGDPIPVAELQRFGSLHEQALEVRKKAYFLEKTLAGPNQNR